MVGLDAAGKTTILYKLKLGEIVTTIPTIGMHMQHSISLKYRLGFKYASAEPFWQDLTLRLSSTRIFNSLSGMLADRTRSDPCGDITFRIPRVSSSSQIAMIVTELLRLGKSCSGCSMRMSLEMRSCLFSPTSKIYQFVGPTRWSFSHTDILQNAMNAAEITDKLGLHSLRQRAWVGFY